MTRVSVSAGKTLLESYIRTPEVGLCELVWNAFDEDASNVSIQIETNDLEGVESFTIEDDGHGMSAATAEKAFSKVGDSWKLPPGSLSDQGRPVHGHHGRGRYTAFSLGSYASWQSTALTVTDELEVTTIIGSREELDSFDVTSRVSAQAPGEDPPTGTTIVIRGITPEAVKAFDDAEALKTKLLSEFALHLQRYDDFSLTFLGDSIEPKEAIEDQASHEVESGDDVATLTIIEWKLEGVPRRLYLCDADGSVIDETAPGVQAVGAEFTAYLSWNGFSRNQSLLLEGDEETPAGRMLAAAKEVLRAHLAESARRREKQALAKWQAEGSYPYKGEAASTLERATRDTFDLVAMASARTINEAKTRQLRIMALGLLKEALENNPEKLIPLLRDFSRLPASRIEELQGLLERTSLAHLITTGRLVGDRIEALNGIRELIFGRETRPKLLERTQLHRILANETWLFGEGWAITGDDENLSVVLEKYLDKLGEEVEFADTSTPLREDGTIAIPDLVLGRRLESQEDKVANLVVELKRPNHKLNDTDVVQVRSYASAIVNDERFNQPNASWEFWLVGNSVTRSVDEQRSQRHLPSGVVQGDPYVITVKTWAEVLGEAEHRLAFIQRSLAFSSTQDSGLAHMRSKYAKYLPQAEVSGGQPNVQEPVEERAGDGVAQGDAELQDPAGK